MRLFFDSELRVEQRDDKPPRIVGYAARFNVKSEDLGGFREVIMPGAFRDSIKSDEVVALWNHDAAKPIARTGNGTLVLEEDDKGLRMEATPDETTWAQDALKSVKAGTVYRTSFGFRIKDAKKDQEFNEDGSLRTLHKVSVFDVSPVTYPAYRQTRISVRASRLADLMERLDEGQELCEAELRYLRSEFPELQRALIAEPTENRGEAEQEQKSREIQAALNLARLRLAETEAKQ